MNITNKQFVGWVLSGFGVVVIVVGSYFNHKVAALTEDMDYGFSTVVRKHQITRTDNHSYDYRVEVILGTDHSNILSVGSKSRANVLVDVTKENFNEVEEGSKLAVVWQRSDPSNNFAGADVVPLVNGSMSESEFAKTQSQKGVLALYGGVGTLALGIFILAFKRGEAR